MNFQHIRNYYCNKIVNIIVVAAFLIFIIFIIFTAGICSGFQGLPVSAVPTASMLNGNHSFENGATTNKKTDGKVTNNKTVSNDKKTTTKKTTLNEKIASMGKSMLASTTALSTKKIGWGIKRNDNHEQPDLGAENKKLIEKFNRTCNGKQRKQEYISNI